ncbi:MAG TPA: hypothetical protein ENK23_06030, partial [Sorangium sp.]|nr:hypothetical protein [Sorangium sp.]
MPPADRAATTAMTTVSDTIDAASSWLLRAARDAPQRAARPPLETADAHPPSGPRPRQRYLAGQLLGVGGQGEVRRVYDRVVGQTVAMKIL